MSNKKLIIILAVLISVIVLTAGFYAISPDIFKGVFSKLKEAGKAINLISEKPQVVEEKLVIPNTQKITQSESRFINEGPVDVPFAPKSEAEKVIVPQAVLTLKASYDLALVEAKNWQKEAKLSFIKSLGAITLEGKSSQWQLFFVSKTKAGKGYEIIIQADKIVSKKEIESKAVGADVPANWPDLGEVIKNLQTHPLYVDATVSGANFYLNPDNKKWYYSLSTSKGVSSISVE